MKAQDALERMLGRIRAIKQVAVSSAARGELTMGGTLAARPIRRVKAAGTLPLGGELTTRVIKRGDRMEDGNGTGA